MYLALKNISLYLYKIYTDFYPNDFPQWQCNFVQTVSLCCAGCWWYQIEICHTIGASSQGQQCAVKLYENCSINPSCHLTFIMEVPSFPPYSHCLAQGSLLTTYITFTSFTGSPSLGDSWCPAPDRKPSWLTLISTIDLVTMEAAIVSSVASCSLYY